jgi:hypothetical protein
MTGQKRRQVKNICLPLNPSSYIVRNVPQGSSRGVQLHRGHEDYRSAEFPENFVKEMINHDRTKTDAN